MPRSGSISRSGIVERRVEAGLQTRLVESLGQLSVDRQVVVIGDLLS
jgi:hypothetical protein